MELATAETQIEHVDYGSIREGLISSIGKGEQQQQQQEGTKNNEQQSSPSKESISYYNLVMKNREYRFFITSFLITNLGEWLTYIASIDLIETQLAKSSSSSGASSPRTAISALVVVRLMPNVFLSCCGGTLADAHDRRIVMVILNILGALCAGIFVMAYELESIGLIYGATFLQQCLAGLYQPSSSSIIPMLVSGDDELKKATTLEGLCWSGMTAFGAAASGVVVDAFGSRICFLLDGATFLISAFLLWLIRGEYNVSEDDKQQKDYESPWEQFKGMSRDGAQYLLSSYFGAIVLFKCTVSLAYGACDVLNVAFSEMDYGSSSSAGATTTTTTVVVADNDSNAKLGILFSLVGIGCLLGPLMTEPFIDVERPTTVQCSCIIGFVFSMIGYIGWSVPGSPFWSIGAFALVRAAGSSIIWINSTLLLQKFSLEHMLGRVLAIDYAFALLGEAASAYMCGILMDHWHLSAYKVSQILAMISLFLSVCWGSYHVSGRGAGKYVPAPLGGNDASDKDKILSTSLLP